MASSSLVSMEPLWSVSEDANEDTATPRQLSGAGLRPVGHFMSLGAPL